MGSTNIKAQSWVQGAVMRCGGPYIRGRMYKLCVELVTRAWVTRRRYKAQWAAHPRTDEQVACRVRAKPGAGRMNNARWATHLRAGERGTCWARAEPGVGRMDEAWWAAHPQTDGAVVRQGCSKVARHGEHWLPIRLGVGMLGFDELEPAVQQHVVYRMSSVYLDIRTQDNSNNMYTGRTLNHCRRDLR
jgi:hypothetical protein